MIRKRHALFIITIIILTYLRIFPALDRAPIQRWDESTNISTVENTRASSSFPALSYLDKPFFEKPPLWYFATMLLTHANISTATSGRLISAVFGFLTILLTTFLSWRWWGPIAAVVTWTILITTNHLFATNPGGSFSTHTLRSADTDSIHIFFLMVSFATAIYIPARQAAIVAGIAAGLSVLSKSPLGILPLCIATPLLLNKSTKNQLALAWIYTTLTILPWYIWMSVRFGMPFINAHVGYHIATRISSPLDGHDKPVWYYIKVLTGRHFFFSWELLAGSAVYLYLYKSFRDIRIRYVFAMMLATFIIPTLVSTKLAWYLLPFYPFASLVIGVAAAKLFAPSYNTQHEAAL